MGRLENYCGSNEDYLAPKEQLVIAAKVNRICNLEPGEIATFSLATYAHDIIRALDSRVLPSGKIQITRKTKKRSGHQIQGATEYGSIEVADFEDIEESKFGVEEYRIGGYVALKTVNKDYSWIDFEPFFGRGEVNETFDNYPDFTSIVYSNQNLRVREILKVRTILKKINLGPLALEKAEYHTEVVWQNFDHHHPPKGVKRKNLLYL